MNNKGAYSVVSGIRIQMLRPTVGADLIRMNSCWKPVGISLRNKSPIEMLLSSGVERILSQSLSTVKGFKLPETPCKGVTCDGLRVSCSFFASVLSVWPAALSDPLDRLTSTSRVILSIRLDTSFLASIKGLCSGAEEASSSDTRAMVIASLHVGGVLGVWTSRARESIVPNMLTCLLYGTSRLTEAKGQVKDLVQYSKDSRSPCVQGSITSHQSQQDIFGSRRRTENVRSSD